MYLSRVRGAAVVTLLASAVLLGGGAASAAPSDPAGDCRWPENAQKTRCTQQARSGPDSTRDLPNNGAPEGFGQFDSGGGDGSSFGGGGDGGGDGGGGGGGGSM